MAADDPSVPSNGKIPEPRRLSRQGGEFANIGSRAVRRTNGLLQTGGGRRRVEVVGGNDQLHPGARRASASVSGQLFDGACSVHVDPGGESFAAPENAAEKVATLSDGQPMQPALRWMPHGHLINGTRKLGRKPTVGPSGLPAKLSNEFQEKSTSPGWIFRAQLSAWRMHGTPRNIIRHLQSLNSLSSSCFLRCSAKQT